MYANTTAVSRPEINAFLQQAQGIEKYFIGQKIFPVLPVKKRGGQYPRMKIAEGSLLRSDVTKRSASGTYNEVGRAHSWDEYVCEDRGLKERIDDDKAAEMKDFFDVEVSTAKLVRRMMLVDFELNVKTRLFDEAVFAKEDAKVNYTEALIATCDFPYDMNLAIEAAILRGVDVNTIVMSQKLWNYIRRTKLLQDYLFGSEPTKKKLIKVKDIGDAFSEEQQRPIEVIVASAGYDTSNRGKKDTPNLTQIWPTSHIWLGDVKGGDFSEGGVGRTLSWSESVKGGGLFQTETYRDEERRGDMVRVRSNSIEKVIDENAGQLIKTNFA